MTDCTTTMWVGMGRVLGFSLLYLDEGLTVQVEPSVRGAVGVKRETGGLAMEIDIESTWDGAPAEDRVNLWLFWDADALVIEVTAPYHGDPRPPGDGGPTDGLWDYEVVEIFLVDDAGAKPVYTEVELSPHGHHLVLKLKGVRCPVSTRHEIEWSAVIDGDRWKGTAVVPMNLLPQEITHYNAYAIHGVGEQRRYLAAHPVPGDAPDFHRLEHFAEWPP